jgi:hypothetical protein
MFGARTLQPGDLVRVRSAREILATLDEDGTVGGIPFMPEMVQYVDRRFRVSKRVEKICWYTAESSSRKLPDTVLLEDLRCDGTAHGGCQAECRIYWKDAWIEQVDPKAPEHRSDEQSLDELRAFVAARTRVTKSFETGPEEVFRCQITESLHASTPLAPREWSQYLAELRSGNVGIVRFLRVFVRMNVWRIAHRLGRRPGMPKVAGADRVDGTKLGLQVGELVEVRPLADIGTTLDDDFRHRGLRYSEEMAPACGKRFRVKSRVDRLIDERTGRMIELKNDCIVLEGFVCSGDRSPSALFCPRAAYPFFREAWLRRVEEQATSKPRSATDPEGASETASNGEVGKQRELDQAR